MNRTTLLWTSALLLVVMAVALNRVLFRDSARIDRNRVVNTTDTHPTTALLPIAANRGAVGGTEGSVQKQLEHTNSGGSQPKLAASAVDRSVIGVPFPVSPSVETSCKVTGKVDLCERPRKVLAKMIQEPRDEAWAAKTEALIQDEVVAEGPGIYSIRNIECRSTTCAVEVESLSDAYVGATSNFINANDLVYGFDMGLGRETDDLGRPVLVTFLFFFKWSAIKAYYESPTALPGSN
jgi:hypothetical protein